MYLTGKLSKRSHEADKRLKGQNKRQSLAQGVCEEVPCLLPLVRVGFRNVFRKNTPRVALFNATDL